MGRCRWPWTADPGKDAGITELLIVRGSVLSIGDVDLHHAVSRSAVMRCSGTLCFQRTSTQSRRVGAGPPLVAARQNARCFNEHYNASEMPILAVASVSRPSSGRNGHGKRLRVCSTSARELRAHGCTRGGPGRTGNCEKLSAEWSQRGRDGWRHAGQQRPRPPRPSSVALH